MAHRSFGARVIGALRLDANTYEDVEHDAQSLPQALVLVVLSSAATGLGSVRPDAISLFVTGTLMALISWVTWSSLVYTIGAKLMPQPQTEADIGQLLRTTGFASAPGLFGVVGAVPGIGMDLLLIVSVWMLLAMLTAVRQALDFTSTWRAFGVVAIGWVVYLTLLYFTRLFLVQGS